MNKLPFKETFSEAFQLGGKNILSLIAATVMYVLTIWIPYLNIGTTIAMESIPALLAKGEVIDPFFIFESKYRRNMGEFFILIGLESLVLFVALLLGIIPAFVMSIAWSLAILLFVDKDLKAMDALRKSNELTYGYKWRIFGLTFIFAFCFEFICSLIGLIFKSIDMTWAGGCIVVILALCFVPFGLGLDAAIYRRLTEEKPADNEPDAEVIVEEVIVEE